MLGHVRHADPAHAGDGRGRDQGDVHHPDPARGAAPGAHLRRAPTTRSRSPRPSGASCSATARSFFVHNRVSSIRKVAAQLAELVPEARIAVAHGQMNEHELEKIMVDFWERNYDVLVATTIVESGLDIPNANTLIIDRADMYGLSQLHQLRGRVGRGSERAYAYFLYPPERSLTETAHERLATVAQHTEIGAGMYVAHEGPGDPRRREPAGRRAVRAHRRGRLRPVRADDRRGGQRAEGRRPGGAARGPGGAAGQRAHPARLRAGRAAPAGGVHADRRDRLRRRRRPRCARS